MLRIGLLAVVLGLGAAVPASASDVDLGAPAKLRIARAADMRAHPEANYEAWLIRAIDPATRRRLSLRVDRVDDEVIDVTLAAPGVPVVETGIGWDPAIGAWPTWRDGGDDSLTVTRARRGWLLSATGSPVDGRVRIRSVRPGAAASRWRYGRDPFDGRQHMSWAQPVLTGITRGRLMLLGFGGWRELDMSGWRISVEHWWGHVGELAGNWMSWVVHQRGARGWSLAGANRKDLTVGPGSRDAMWFGVLTRATRRGVSICRPRIHRRPNAVVAPTGIGVSAIRARCRGRTVTMEYTRDYGYGSERVVRAAGGGIGTVLNESPAARR